MDLGACLFPKSGEVGEGGLPRPLLDSTPPQPLSTLLENAAYSFR